MPHKDNNEEYEDKDYKIESVKIRKSTNGSFIYTVEAKKEKEGNNPSDYASYEYVYDTIDEITDAMQDDFESGHVRKTRAGGKPKLGTGERFRNLTSELSRKGARSPAALAAYIGRKKYGKTKFAKLSSEGRK